MPAVTPFVGVWIETTKECGINRMSMSHPSWVCGLKLTKKRITLSNLASPPSWVCGLKHGELCQDDGERG